MQSFEKEISVVIPAYNSSGCIKDIITQVNGVLITLNTSYEIIVVDDGSADNTWKIIKEISNENKLVKGFSLAKNFGQHKATLCGLSNASGKYVITIDDDFEHNPSDIVVLYNAIVNSEFDLVYGVPRNKKKSFARQMMTSFYKFISKVENPYAGLGSSFRILKNDLVKKIVTHNNHLFFIDELVLWYTSNISSSQLDFQKSKRESSGYSFISLFRLSSNVLMISSTMPLKLVKTLGLSMSFVSFLIGTFYFLKKILFKSPAGYTSIIVSVLFSAGMIMFCIGIIGEYLGNVLMMQNHKPAFYIKDKT
ncbi:MAG: glycosyltransferase family 2 protein [Bacteroidota bacterium]